MGRNLLAVIVLGLSVISANTYAFNRHASDARAMGTPSFVVASNKALSLAQAADKLRNRVGGRVLGAKVVEAEGRTVYEIKVLLKPGKVKVYWVDPHSGKVL